MNRRLEVLLAFIWIAILVATLFILTKAVIQWIPALFMAIKNWKSRWFKDVVLLIVLIFCLWLFIYDWWIFFVKMYDLIKYYS